MCVCVSGVRNVRFSENLAHFVFLKHPFWDSYFCPITDVILPESAFEAVNGPFWLLLYAFWSHQANFHFVYLFISSFFKWYNCTDLRRFGFWICKGQSRGLWRFSKDFSSLKAKHISWEIIKNITDLISWGQTGSMRNRRFLIFFPLHCFWNIKTV